MKRWKKWAQHGAALGIGLWAFACSDGGKTTQTTGAAGGNGGTGGTGGTMEASSSSASVSSSSIASSSTGGAGGVGGSSMGFVCDPPAEPGSLYEHAAESYDINDFEPVSMCKYRGKVMLVVNTAAA